MPADAGYWVERKLASQTQNGGNLVDVWAVDAQPPIHAGSRVSPDQAELFRSILNGSPDADDGEQQASASTLINLEMSDDAPVGVGIIRRFATQRGDILMSLPPTPTSQG